MLRTLYVCACESKASQHTGERMHECMAQLLQHVGMHYCATVAVTPSATATSKALGAADAALTYG